MNLHQNKDIFSDIIAEVSFSRGIPEQFIEKDYYVSLLLRKIVDSYPSVVFKGGTSLSKCYGLIDRFSEDIDISVHYSVNINDKVRRELKEKIVNAISNVQLDLVNLSDIKTRSNFNQYKIGFPSVSATIEGLRDYLLVETYLFLKPFPYETREVSNYIYDYLIENNFYDIAERFNLATFDMKVQKIDRTLVDKLFAICDFFEKKSFTQNSRHLYDIHKIWSSNGLNKSDLKRLIIEVASHRSENKRSVSAKKGYSLIETLNKIISEDVFEKDYNKITEQLLYSSCSYEEVIVSLEDIVKSDILPKKIKHLDFV